MPRAEAGILLGRFGLANHICHLFTAFCGEENEAVVLKREEVNITKAFGNLAIDTTR